VSLRKTLNSHTPFHFDYFSVDLNEEYSALFGGVLLDQTDFVHHCLRRILELYENNTNKPTSVVLIGHSMVCKLTVLLFRCIKVMSV
jgi:glycosylphosphatidylinositol deacylase